MSLCECGCGCEARPGRRFISGHQNRGRSHSAETRHRISEFRRGKASGTNNPRWRGDEVSVHQLHQWLRHYYPKTGICEECNTDVGIAQRTGTEYSNIHGRGYTRNRADYRELCKRCHRTYDAKEQTR